MSLTIYREIYDLMIYDLMIYDLMIYDLMIYDLMIYDLMIYDLMIYDHDVALGMLLVGFSVILAACKSLESCTQVD
jgi:hypothetical protein